MKISLPLASFLSLCILSSCGQSRFSENVDLALQKNEDQKAAEAQEDFDDLVIENVYSPRDYDNSELESIRDSMAQSQEKKWDEKSDKAIVASLPASVLQTSGACSGLPVNVRSLFFNMTRDLKDSSIADSAETLNIRAAKLMGLSKPESGWIFSNITIHATTKKGHAESKAPNFYRKKDPSNDKALFYWSSVKDALDGFEDKRLKSRISKTTNFGLLQISPDQFVRSYVKELVTEIYDLLPEAMEMNLRVTKLVDWCRSRQAFHDVDENLEAYAQLIKELDGFKPKDSTEKWNSRRFHKNPVSTGKFLLMCPNLNLRMGYIIAKTSGFSTFDDSSALKYFGTRRQPPQCYVELGNFIKSL